MEDENLRESHRQPGAEDDVAPLLHLAGPRPRLPEERVEPIRTAAREVFRRQARRTARRRQLGWAVGVGVAASLLLTVGLVVREPAGRDSRQPVAIFEVRSGEVSATDAMGRPSGPGAVLAGMVVTTGAGGRAAVRLPSGPAVRIDAESSVRFDSSRSLTLERGALYVDSGAAHPVDSGLEIATVLGSVRDVGTQFEARLLTGAERDPASASLRIRVREGKVLVTRGGEEHQAHAGGELVLQADGGLQQSEVAIYGPGWDWVQHAAPALAIEGASLADFLRWVSRETGLRWRFAGPRAGEAPEDIILHGSIDGLTAEEALAVVLPGCGYRHRRSGDQLWLESAERPGT